MSPSISGIFATYFCLLCCLSVLMTYTELLHFPITCYSSLTMLMVLTLNYVLIYIHVAIHAGFVFSVHLLNSKFLSLFFLFFSCLCLSWSTGDCGWGPRVISYGFCLSLVCAVGLPVLPVLSRAWPIFRQDLEPNIKHWRAPFSVNIYWTPFMCQAVL